MTRPIVFCLILVLGFPTLQPTGAQTVATVAPPFKNLQVLSKDVSRDDLLAAMKGFSTGLGVRCNFCHVVTNEGPPAEFDFASDAKEHKRVARVMVQMAAQINGKWLPEVAAAEGDGDGEAAKGQGEGELENPHRVSCWTCHRGKAEPEMPPPPSPPPSKPAQ